MLIEINTTGNKEVLIQPSTIIAVRVAELLTDHLNCVDYLRDVDSIKCNLPQDITVDDMALLLTEYFGASKIKVSDRIVITKE
ncbi:hypothetical protein [Aneurinibacillus tyrosinisolvens]|uniref:hypothetical protein n=1 Tax=Aneurinibacillus tyrosinisolvens TaxID=1443435 RepID=UPI00063F91A2|nr:hypothetical protein [Aneurinibacillus tyrosinisolvens]